jgi:predicted MFS family arabinose efflux permease
MKLFAEYRHLRKENYILFISRTITALGMMIYPMLTLILSQKLMMKAGTIAIVLVAFSLLCIPMNLIGGKIADTFSKKKIIVFCNGTAGLCFLICACIPLSYLSMSIYALGAVILQMQNPGYSSLIADITPDRDRSRAYSLSYLGMNLGMVLSPTIAGFLFQDYLWLMFLLNGIALLASILLILFFFDDTKVSEEHASSYERAEDHASAFAVLKQNKILLVFFIIMAIDSAVYNQYSYLIPLDLGTVHGSEGAVIFGTMSSINCLVVVLFTPLITRVFSHLSDTRKFLVSDILMVASYAVFRLLLGSIFIYYLVMMVYTWGEIFRTISSDPYLTQRIPQSHRGRLMAFNNVGMSAAYAISEVIVGQCYEKIGSIAAWIVVIALGSVSIVLEFWLIKADRQVYPEIYEKLR